MVLLDVSYLSQKVNELCIFSNNVAGEESLRTIVKFYFINIED